MAKNKKKIKSKVQQQPTAKPDRSLHIEKVINDSVTAAIASSVPPVLMKVCRLCGAKEGPFLNIFDQDQITAVKIDQLMPFRIEENDDLPHKICFRCSAKLEELHEFVSKCIRTQENLHTTIGRKAPVISKTNTRQMWEEKLNKSNMTNDDICNALIKKAMEGIKDIPLSPKEEKEEPVIVPKKEIKAISKPGPLSKKEVKSSENDVQLKQMKLTIDKCDDEPKTRSLRSKISEKPESPVEKRVRPIREATKPVIQDSSSDEDDVQEEPKNMKITDLSFDFDDDSKTKKVEEPKQMELMPAGKPKPPDKPFNIMDHICMIKVNGVGVLFQCKLCNRNFLKKEVVQSHSCAKNGVPKVDVAKSLPPPEPPKIATVKYINTKVDDSKKVPVKEVKEEPIKPSAAKPKPRIGPASKVRHNESDTATKDLNTNQQIPQQQTPQPMAPANPVALTPIVNFPSLPGLNGRFRLVPGPNNTFTLLEDTSVPKPATVGIIPNNISSNSNSAQSHTGNATVLSTTKEDTKKSRKRKSNNPSEEKSNSFPTVSEQLNNPRMEKGRNIIDLESSPAVTVMSRNAVTPQPASNVQDQPYPVGLFQTMARTPNPPAFTTPAMKKQSYTVIQTGNPGKLLISSKPQAPPVEEVPKKRPKKPKVTKKPEEESQEPFNVTIEDTSHPKDPGFFTFINVDPLLQPSYVLPTDNIIQESQISTSTTVSQTATANKDKDKYSCNMCNETFSREKKLLAHIQSHYTKMDEEDQRRAEKSEPRRKSRKS